MALIAGLVVIVLGIGIVWTLLAHYHIVPPLRWHGGAAWAALTQGRAVTHSSSISRMPARSALAPVPPVQGVLAKGVTPFTPRALGGYATHWGLWIGLAVALLIVAWMAWGTAVWLYNVPSSARRGDVWRDWIVWRWPVISVAQWLHRGDAQKEAWARHKRTWVMLTDSPAATADLAHAAHVLDAGFATSKPDVAWTTLPDGTTARRMTVVAADGLIHPHWAMGFHAGTMQEWVQWATQWAETALHHAGITGTWTVSAEGIVRRGRESASSPRGEDAPPVEPPKSTVEGLPDATQWGQDGLRWGQLRAAAADPLPVLSGPIPPERVQDVVRVLGHLGFPDTVAIGGQRGLTVDVAKIRPPAALAKRILGESATLAGQLGHGELPLRMAYVEGAPGVIAVERPRPDRQFVDLVTALARTDKQTRQSLKNMALPVCCLVKSDGTPFWSDAATWPHLLAGGTTGGGKTVSLVGWLASLMITVPPTRLRISLVDPKAGASFPWAKHAPHVDALVKTPQEVCQLVAQWADEADARFEEFAHGGVEDLAAAMAAGWTQYPYRLLVVDEYKDLKDQLEKDDLKELERNIGRLGQKARGAGLLLWIATQHPLAETIDSTLKANLPTRLALKVANTVGSQVILDSPGAETLLGRGDALFKSSSMGVAIRGQTPLATEGVWQVIRDGWAKKA